MVVGFCGGVAACGTYVGSFHVYCVTRPQDSWVRISVRLSVEILYSPLLPTRIQRPKPVRSSRIPGSSTSSSLSVVLGLDVVSSVISLLFLLKLTLLRGSGRLLWRSLRLDLLRGFRALVSVRGSAGRLACGGNVVLCRETRVTLRTAA
jgi:hypothetical protein